MIKKREKERELNSHGCLNTATPGPLLHTCLVTKNVRQNYLDTIAKLLCEARIVYYRASDFQNSLYHHQLYLMNASQFTKLFTSALSYIRITKNISSKAGIKRHFKPLL